MIPSDQAHVHLIAKSDPGKVGKNNEDLFSVAAYQVSATNPTPALFAIVADGVGGHLAGEVAASVAVEMISKAVAESDASQPTAIMQAAIIQASQTILTQAESDPKKQGMGTTVVCVWLVGDQLYTAAVGNSRIYLIRKRKMVQVNVDHTWVQEAVEIGALKPESTRNHPNANIILRNLGMRTQLQVDLRLRLKPKDSNQQMLANQGARLYPGGRLLLCSDGLNDMVEDKDILGIARNDTLDEASQKLIDKANQMGGKDNITVVMLEMPKKPLFG